MFCLFTDGWIATFACDGWIATVFLSCFYLQAGVGSHPAWQEAEEMSDWDGSDLENFSCIFWGGACGDFFFTEMFLVLLQSLRKLEATQFLRDCWECGRRSYVTGRCWMRRSDC